MNTHLMRRALPPTIIRVTIILLLTIISLTLQPERKRTNLAAATIHFESGSLSTSVVDEDGNQIRYIVTEDEKVTFFSRFHPA